MSGKIKPKKMKKICIILIGFFIGALFATAILLPETIKQQKKVIDRNKEILIKDELIERLYKKVCNDFLLPIVDSDTSYFYNSNYYYDSDTIKVVDLSDYNEMGVNIKSMSPIEFIQFYYDSDSATRLVLDIELNERINKMEDIIEFE